MPGFGNRMLHALTRRIHGVDPRVPIVTEWPGTRRIYERLLAPVRLPVLVTLATRHRQRLDATTFIGITGSAGKTMTKAMVGAVLGSRYRGIARRGTSNFLQDVAANIRAVRDEDEYCVIELSADSGPTSLCKPLAMLKPDIGVVTNIGTDHFSSYRSREAIAEEKGRLIRTLRENGVAVLNADDPRVIAMRARCRARIISYGVAADADVRAERISASWPERLSFVLVHGSDRVHVQTRMCGTQWVSAALSAAAVGLAMDVSLTDIARSLGTVEPFVGRMSSLELPDGTTFIRDDWKASLHTIPPALDFLRAARAARKIAVIGTISDYAGESRAQYVRTARSALEVADLVVFVGPRAPIALRAKPADEPERLRAYSTVKAAADFFSTFLENGDLVLLKGSNPADHLYRIALSRTSPVTCWRGDCRKSVFCNSCRFVSVEKPPGGDRRSHDGAATRRVSAAISRDIGLSPGSEILVGLGNPGRKYAGTPHNVGYMVLDRIAREAGAVWSEAERLQIARVDWRGTTIFLLKPGIAINHSGRILHEFLGPLGIEPKGVVLVFDDTNLPLGKVRVRMRGSDGGHLGVRSILDAFQSDRFRRVRIGVRHPEASQSARQVVLRPFSASEEAVMATAVQEACCRLQELVTSTHGEGSCAKRAAGESIA